MDCGSSSGSDQDGIVLLPELDVLLAAKQESRVVPVLSRRIGFLTPGQPTAGATSAPGSRAAVATKGLFRGCC